MGFGWRRRSSRNTTNKVVSPLEELVIPNHFLCPISLDLMRDPVTLSSGITYDRDSIEKWLHATGNNFTCPVTKQALTSFDLIPNHTLRKMTQEWCVRNLQDRIPTPRIPVTPFEVSRTLLVLSESTRSADSGICSEAVKKIKNWGEESDRNRRCISGNRASATTLAAAFETFSSMTKHYPMLLLEEILSVLDWMFPLDLESLNYFGRPSSIHCLVQFLETGDLSVRKTAASVLKELSCDPSNVDTLVEAHGVLVKLIEQPISAAVTKASLTIVFNLISSSTRRSEEIKLRFAETGLVEVLIETLADSEKSISEKALAVLFRLCSCEEGRGRAYGHSLAVPVLVKKILRVSELATEFSVSTLWSLIGKCENWDDQGKMVVEMLHVGVFQKLLLLLQIGSGEETKEKATELLKVLNRYRAGLECIDSVDFKSLKRSF